MSAVFTLERRFQLKALIGMVAGYLAALLIPTFSFLNSFVFYAEIISKFWICLILLLVLPLVCTVIITSIASADIHNRISIPYFARAMGIHILLILCGVSIATVYSKGLVDFFGSSLRIINHQDVSIDSSGGVTWLSRVQSIITSFLIPSFAVAFLVALIIRNVKVPYIGYFLSGLTSLRTLLFNVLNIILLFLPFVIACFAFVITAKSSNTLIGFAAFYVIGVCALLILFVGFIFLVVVIVRRKSFQAFVQAVFPTQIFAASTCSSLATLSVMLTHIDKVVQRSEMARAALPIFVSLFRINLMVANPFSFFLLCHIYSIPFDSLSYLYFIGLMFLVSLGSPGLPQTGNVYSMPVFLAVGVPLEGIILIKALDAIPDIFKTVLNVTETMAVTVLAERNRISTTS